MIFFILVVILYFVNIVFMFIEEIDGVFVVDEYLLYVVVKLLGIDDEVEFIEVLILNVSIIKGKFLIFNFCYFCCCKYVDIENVYNREND